MTKINENIFKSFEGLYPVSKTLSFELVPTRETKARLEETKYEILESDKERDINYVEAKKIIDDYYRHFIDECLINLKIDNEEIKNMFKMYCDLKDVMYNYKESDKKESMEQISKEYNKKKDKNKEHIQKLFNDEMKNYDLDKFEKMFKAGSKLHKFIINQFEDREITKEVYERNEKVLESFSKFVTFFKGFRENRKNVFSVLEGVSIASRIIDENMEIYFDNCLKFIEINESNSEIFRGVYNLEMFSIDNYISYLAQTRINDYNKMLGTSGDNETKGINQTINLYNQKHDKKIPIFSRLKKQILSDSIKESSFSGLENDIEMIDLFKENVELALSTYAKTNELLKNNRNNIIYFKKNKINLLMQDVFGDWQKVNLKSDDSIKLNKRIELIDINTLKIHLDNEEICTILSYLTDDSPIKKLKKDFIDFIEFNKVNNFTEINNDRRIPNEDNPEGGLGYIQIQSIKNILDQITMLSNRIAPINIVFKGQLLIEPASEAAAFYSDFKELNESFRIIMLNYDLIRNYCTKKPYSNNKKKINFNSSEFLDGWDINKEEQHKNVMLLKDDKFYLGYLINNKCLIKTNENKMENKNYNKVLYRQMSGAAKSLPHMFFPKDESKRKLIDEEILKIYDGKSFKKSDKKVGEDEFDIESMHRIINYYKDCISSHEDLSKYFRPNFTDTKSYNSISEFFREADNQMFLMKFVKIDEELVEHLVTEGDLLLFEICNKDFKDSSKGKPNLFTIYWKALFSKENLDRISIGEKPFIKLNGGAEMFFREASLERKITHKKNTPIKNKYVFEKSTSEFSYDLYKDRRFMSDKFSFHCPITMNYRTSACNTKLFNETVNQIIKEEKMNIIGIDRGENNLLYVSVIDQDGKILLQKDLNTIGEKGRQVNYNTILSKKQEERDEARKNWATIDKIKDIKKGYLSCAVNEIVKLMLEYNAVIVLEDLDLNFKRGRQFVEKQIYQNFESALVSKLNYLVLKSKENNELGGALRGLQLTPALDKVRKLEGQIGFLRYINPWMTSKKDPSTGYVSNFIYPEKLNEQKKFIESFEKISFNKELGCFIFETDLSKFNEKLYKSPSKWNLCSIGERYYYDRNEKKQVCMDLTKTIKKLLVNANISYGDSIDIRGLLNEKGQAFLKEFIDVFRKMNQLRNSYTKDNKKIDAIFSPVLRSDNTVFDSRKVVGNEFPIDADANGAYNIALKGLQIIKNDFKIQKNEEWLKFSVKMAKYGKSN
ncbi:MAG: type V CRISPR-associated protein Cas12a/Cpf1 [Bacilli bacterium]